MSQAVEVRFLESPETTELITDVPSQLIPAAQLFIYSVSEVPSFQYIN